MFFCPGCDEAHSLRAGIWSFNGDFDRPTFSPSILVKSGHYCQGQDGKPCWCTYEQRFGKRAPFSCYICHSFVREGQIQFLADCTHSIAGQTVVLPDWPYASGAYGGIEDSV